MKNTLIALGIWIALGTAAYGQSRYEIPFAFQIGDRHLAAGHYAISMNPMNGALTLSPAAGTAIFLRQQSRVEAPAAAGRLVFHCYGHSCFLAQVWRNGDPSGTQLMRSASERELAKSYSVKPVAIVQASLR